MKYHVLSGGMKISRVGIGNMSWPGCFWGVRPDPTLPVHAGESREIVAIALDHGITLFDTAEAYGLGFAEEALGDALRTLGRRDEAVIQTKVGPLFGEEVVGGRTCNLSPAHIKWRCDQSLRRLHTDRIDLYLAHWPDPVTPVTETIGAMQELVTAGKIRAFGVSNFDRPLLEQALAAGPVAVNQVPFSLVDRRVENGLTQYCRATGVGVLAYSPIGKGLLSGKYDGINRPPAGDYRHGMSEFSPENSERNARLVVACRGFAGQLKVSPVQIALAWALAQPGLAAVLPGPKTVVQLIDCAQAGDLTLPTGVIVELNRLSAIPPG